MCEPRPDWSPVGVNFKILDEHPHLFYIRVSRGGEGGGLHVPFQSNEYVSYDIV